MIGKLRVSSPVYVIRHRNKEDYLQVGENDLVSWVPRQRASEFNSRGEAEVALRRYGLAKAAPAVVEEWELPPPPPGDALSDDRVGREDLARALHRMQVTRYSVRAACLISYDQIARGWETMSEEHRDYYRGLADDLSAEFEVAARGGER